MHMGTKNDKQKQAEPSNQTKGKASKTKVDQHELRDLAFNEADDSFELDVESEDKDYYHPDPYHTSVKGGSDFNSDYDEANREANNEYRKMNPEDKHQLMSEEYGMHIDNGDITRVKPIDELLSHTDEDDRDDLDEEGYPVNDKQEEPQIKKLKKKG